MHYQDKLDYLQASKKQKLNKKLVKFHFWLWNALRKIIKPNAAKTKNYTRTLCNCIK